MLLLLYQDGNFSHYAGRAGMFVMINWTGRFTAPWGVTSGSSASPWEWVYQFL